MTTTSARYKVRYGSSRPPENDEEPPARSTCFAKGCPMAPAISDGGKRYCCAYHYGIQSEDVPRVTSVLNQHRDLRDVINHARRLTGTSDMAHHALAAEWHKLRDLMLFAGYEDPKEASITAWIYACERMLAAYTFEMLKTVVKPHDLAPRAPT